MKKISLFVFYLLAMVLNGCAVVSHHVASVPSFDSTPSFDTEKVYKYGNKEVSFELEFNGINLDITSENTEVVERHVEIMLVSLGKEKVHHSSPKKSPFRINVGVKGEKGEHMFYPYRSTYQNLTKVNSVKYLRPVKCEEVKFPIEADTVEHDVEVSITNDVWDSCYRPNMPVYVLEFDAITPRPDDEFAIELYFKNILTNRNFRKKVYFSGATFVTVSTH